MIVLSRQIMQAGRCFGNGEPSMRFLRVTPDLRARCISALMMLSVVAAILAGAADCKWT